MASNSSTKKPYTYNKFVERHQSPDQQTIKQESTIMNEAYEFMKSDLGVAISWICTVASTVITLLTTNKNKSLKEEIAKVKINQESIVQKGQKNVYTKKVSGDMNIKM